jgi:hypothetical protein
MCLTPVYFWLHFNGTRGNPTLSEKPHSAMTYDSRLWRVWYSFVWIGACPKNNAQRPVCMLANTNFAHLITSPRFSINLGTHSFKKHHRCNPARITTIQSLANRLQFRLPPPDPRLDGVPDGGIYIHTTVTCPRLIQPHDLSRNFFVPFLLMPSHPHPHKS